MLLSTLTFTCLLGLAIIGAIMLAGAIIVSFKPDSKEPNLIDLPGGELIYQNYFAAQNRLHVARIRNGKE